MNRAALVLEHAEMAKGVALGFCRDRHLPHDRRDEIVQEAYVALAQAAESWDPLRGPFSQWARMRIGFHLLDISRKDGPLTRRQYAAGEKPPRMVELIEEFIEDTEEEVPLDEIASLLEGLRLRERQVLLMRYQEALSLEDTAARMGVAPSRVWQIEKQALKRLRDRLTNPGEWPVRALRGQPLARRLTERQAEVLLHGAHGLNVEETAKVMGLDPNTVRQHRKAASIRLGAKGRFFMPNLVYIAVREGHIT